jgi:hypothetical protein
VAWRENKNEESEKKNGNGRRENVNNRGGSMAAGEMSRDQQRSISRFALA